jgi:phosphohistidine phosphatase SixA
VRAAQTADPIGRVLKLAVREWPLLQSEVEPRQTSRGLKELGDAGAAVFVGHEPHLSGWIADLAAGPQGMRCVMKKAGAACVEIGEVPPPAGSGTLRWLLTPKQLALIGRPE